MTAEQFIKDYTNHCSNELADGGFNEWLTPEQAHRAVEIAKDAFIEKAVNYLNSKLYDWVQIEHPNPSVSHNTILKQDFIEEFKNYMNYMEGV